MFSFSKTLIRRFFRSLGVEVARTRPSNSPLLQLTTAIRLSGANVVLDIGANEGQFASSLREYGYKGEIISFEPLSSAHRKLVDVSVSDPSWKVHDRLAIGNYCGEIEINIAGNSVSSSVLPILKSHTDAAIESAYIGKERVLISDLDSVARSYLSPASCPFIKIDTQGFEWQVLDGASETLQKAVGLVCELSLVALYEDQRLWLDIINRLELEGFALWALLNGFTDPRSGRTLQVDAIFLRKF